LGLRIIPAAAHGAGPEGLTMHHLAHLRSTVALGVWMVLLFLFLLRGNRWLPREGPARTPRVVKSLLFTACLAPGFLLVPGFPVLGAA
jgi:hypothetical protein